MAGRHQNPAAVSKARRIRLLLLAAVVAVVVAAGVLTAVTLHSSRRSTAATGSTAPTCSSGVALTVVATPALASVLSNIATHWAAGRPVIDGACPTVTVRSMTAAAEEQALAKPDVTLPDVWIPDSSLWIQQLKTDTAGIDSGVRSLWLYPSIGSSPLVLATSATNAPVVTAAAKNGWVAALAMNPPVSVVDPSASTVGLLTVLSAQGLLPSTTGTPSTSFVNAMVGLSRSVVASTDVGFLDLAQHPSTKTTFPASELDVVAANTNSNAASANSIAVAVYPSGKALSLDYPVAQFAPPGGNPAQRDAATQFVAALSTPANQLQLRTAGLRDAAGTPLPTKAGSPATSAVTVDTLQSPTLAQLSDGQRVWDAAGRTNRTLVVIDTSGSMSDSIGGGQSKIQFAAAAERAAIDFFPNEASLGLWNFSDRAKPSNDWTELVSLGPLGSSLGNTTRRQSLITAAASLPGRTGGNTALYNTALAAYQAVRNGYDPNEINSVVLLTDGSNTDTTGVDLPTLLSTLRSQTTAARPLPIITIAIGKDADVDTLNKISEATGGTTLTAAQPSDIRNALIDAIVQAGSP